MSESQQGQALSGRQIALATAFVMVGFVISRLLGLVRNALIGSIFGLGFEADAYLTALRPPETIFLVVAGGALGSAFIPTFTSYLAQGKHNDAWRLTNSIVNLITLIILVIAGLSGLFAHPIVSLLLAPDFTPDKQALTANLMRIMLITPVIFGVSGLQMGVLNAHQRFLLPALAPGMYNLGIIFGLIFLTPIMGVYGAAWGTVIGALAHFLVQLPGVISIRMPYRPLLDLRHPGVAEVARLMGPRVIGLAIVQINFWVNINLASGMVEGSVSALQLAFMLLLLPQGVIAQSVATAVFPTFSAQAAHKDYDALRRTFGRVLRAVLFLSIPATVGLVLLRLPIVRILFERNMFTLTDSRATAWALLFFGLGLVAHSLVEIVTRAFYAMHDTRTPVLIGGAAMVLNVILSLTLIRFIGVQGDLARGPFAGLALANTLATTLEGVLLLVYLKPRVGGLEGRKLLLSVGKAGLASIVMGGVIVLLGPLGQNLGLLIGTIIIIALGGVAFWGVAWLLGSDEARLLTRVILTRLQQ